SNIEMTGARCVALSKLIPMGFGQALRQAKLISGAGQSRTHFSFSFCAWASCIKSLVTKLASSISACVFNSLCFISSEFFPQV
ncbi:MAG: hypothetical protein AAGC93_23415, partial [Cyanobacteria bacterium P01_F01_bin.53]